VVPSIMAERTGPGAKLDAVSCVAPLFFSLSGHGSFVSTRAPVGHSTPVTSQADSDLALFMSNGQNLTDSKGSPWLTQIRFLLTHSTGLEVALEISLPTMEALKDHAVWTSGQGSLAPPLNKRS
jgi:hypothetical protein